MKNEIIKKLNLKEEETGLYKGFYCDGGYYDDLKEYLAKLKFETIFYEDWYYIKYIKEDENLLFELVEGDLYLYDLNKYDTTLNTSDLKEFYEETEELNDFNNLNFEEIEEFIKLDENERDILKFLLENNLVNNFEEGKEKIEEVYIYNSWDEITENFIECNFSDVPENLKWYIDEDKIKNELEINGSYYEYNDNILEVAF